MKYEDAIKQLEINIEKLESGELSLEDSTKIFEESTSLAKLCSELINSNKGKVTVLREELGKIVEKELN